VNLAEASAIRLATLGEVGHHSHDEDAEQDPEETGAQTGRGRKDYERGPE
jgi:hypothetical protein